MTIATSVLIGSSRTMRQLLLVMAGFASLAWVCLLYWCLSSTNLFVASLQLVMAFLLFCLVFRIVFKMSRQTLSFRLDVNSEGELLLRRLDASKQVIESDSVKLISPLILWSSLLLLSLQNEHGKVTHLLILRDSVSRTAFRRLSLAFHWLAQAQTHVATQNDLS